MDLTGQLDPDLAALIEFAAAIVRADSTRLELAVGAMLQNGTAPIAVDELLLQSVLTAGWPRTLMAASIWRAASGRGAEAGEPVDGCTPAEWTARGETTCATIYGTSYGRLRENVRQLHPALDSWMVTDGYARTLSRPGLSLAHRELCTVAQTAVLATPEQLHSHLLGALRSGASIDDVAATLQLVRPWLDDAEWDVVALRWTRVQASWRRAQ